ncbi:hypothetical protein ACFFOS_14990 [Nocardioides kongjuensis]|uniref:Flagellin-like hook-associated protein FlgL n=1 Tax=Nocardioides kongjuensis TaxID=349522 RepID=A0A852RCU9_9ACTN|nr:hypothetical protein [Nocardioides kongjuensis]NYD31421.1 flagellin-like hook-associated protein FlgL [Nocardioides kongjuensis]
MKSSQRPAVVAVLVALPVLLLLAGCGVVSKPDATAWDDQATQALTDAGSEVATARLALESARRERTWSSYTTVLVAEAEEAAAKAEEDLSRLQVPASRRDDAAQVLDLLDHAVDLVSEARAHAVAGRYDDKALVHRLDHLSDQLQQAAP